MADPIQLDLLRRSVTEWNTWRRSKPYPKPAVDLSEAGLSKADLRKADLAHANLNHILLDYADLREADLSEAILRKAILRKAILSYADLREADLSYADLRGSNLSNTDLREVNFNDANLSDTNLSYADLRRTNLRGANLRGANLHNAIVDDTPFGDRDFRQIRGLDTIDHRGPSPLSINSIYLSQGDITEAFVRGTGAPDTFLEYIHALTAHPIEYYTCFISYSSKDQSFAERLYADLQHNGVRCWFAPHNMRPGTVIVRGIDEAIHLYDKLLLVLSQHSVESTWVEFEVAAALEKEKDQQKDTLFPIRLDDTILTTKQAWAAGIRRQRHIGDFTQWKNHDTYQLTFDRLLRDLKQEKT